MIDGSTGMLSPEEQDEQDSLSIYNLLKNEIIPLFFDRDDDGIPRRWMAKIRNSIRTIVPKYNTHRMVADYANDYYFPAKRS
jgi:starch phosphorylase